jgi:hypothetical protein
MKTEVGSLELDRGVPLTNEMQSPFESIEGAQEYLRLLTDTVQEARHGVDSDISTHVDRHARRLQALRIVSYKLEKLEHHMKSSRRLLNDLRSLRRLLFEERGLSTVEPATSPSVETEAPESEPCW